MKLFHLIFLINFLILFVVGEKIISNNFIKKTSRIIGGEEVTITGYVPYQILIETIYDVPMCGGAIIHKKFILTAANCVAGWNKNIIKIITGTNNRLIPDATYFLDDIYIHPNYNQPHNFNDIALLKLNRTIKFNWRTKLIKFDDYDDLVEGDKLIITGWGITKLWSEASIQLKIIEMNYVPYAKCKKQFKKNDAKNIDPLGHMCTFSKKNEGTCYMDAGNPVVRNGTIVGIVNWGKPCALGFPDINARVSYYSYWIGSVIGKK